MNFYNVIIRTTPTWEVFCQSVELTLHWIKNVTRSRKAEVQSYYVLKIPFALHIFWVLTSSITKVLLNPVNFDWINICINIIWLPAPDYLFSSWYIILHPKIISYDNIAPRIYLVVVIWVRIKTNCVNICNGVLFTREIISSALTVDKLKINWWSCSL